MRDLPAILAMALGGALVVAVPGVLVLRALRRRSIVFHIGGLVVIAVLAVLAGIIAVAQGMFLSRHDLNVLMVVVAISGIVSLVLALLLGRWLAADAMWADEARERERRAEAGRRELVAWVSHDLRTPLAGLRAMTEALEDGVVTDPATVADYLRRIRGETDRMARLVDDLFELSRINAGALKLDPVSLPLGEVVSDAVASAAPVAQARGITVDAGREGWPTVRGSEPELGRVVANLLGNAIRYSRPGGTVHLTGGQDGEGAWFAVTDACGGIAEPDLPRVFDVGFRGEPARTPRSNGDGGGGLGLAIVRGLVEAHGGRVTVSNADGGCRFQVHLPPP